ncbi:MAG: hypothetical protein WD055_02045 [Candidatus Dependentiae bacterium]
MNYTLFILLLFVCLSYTAQEGSVIEKHIAELQWWIEKEKEQQKSLEAARDHAEDSMEVIFWSKELLSSQEREKIYRQKYTTLREKSKESTI